MFFSVSVCVCDLLIFLHYPLISRGAGARAGAADGARRFSRRGVVSLHVEYAERGNEYGILFIINLFCEYFHLEYVRVHVIYRVNQAEYVIHILVVVPQEYVNIYATRRVVSTVIYMV